MAVDLENLKQLLNNKLKEHFGEDIISLTESHGELTLVVAKAPILKIMQVLRDDVDFQFNFLTYITAVDYSAQARDVRFDVVYHLLSLTKGHRLRVRAAVAESDATIDSMYSLWEVANYQEREAYDMFGITFKGHPNMKRILMPDDWEGHPLRKDFPLGGVKSFYFKRSSDPHAGEPKNLVPRIRVQKSDI